VLDYGFLWAWEPVRPDDVAGLLAALECPWWICGGWALDLFLGAETRRHDDLDVAVLRRDQLALYRYLREWDLRYATSEHALEPWSGGRLEPPIHGIWARRQAGATAPWTCEFLLNEARDREWIFRRNDAVTLPIDEIGAERDGIPFLRPEIILLFKAGEPSPKNETDFVNVRPQLSRAGTEWLRGALAACDPRHAWLRQL
jgi:hypothetical protein